MPKFLTYIVFLFVLFAGLSLHAQETPSIKLSIDRNQILIGEPIRLSMDVKSPFINGNELPQFDSLPHFEVIDKVRMDSLISADGASYHMEWKITSFDSGTRVIPALIVNIGKQIYRTDSLMVEVSYGSIDTTKDYHDIKSIIDIQNPAVKYVPWLVGIATLIGLFLFIWFIRHPFPKESIAQRKPDQGLTPLEDAMRSLDILKKLPLNDQLSVKKYYSGMNDVLRVFLHRHLGMITMEKTNEELILGLSDLKLDREKFSKLTAALRMSDFVKFAKYIPGPFENDENLELIRSSIITINETGK
jgi:hypothetical protein